MITDHDWWGQDSKRTQEILATCWCSHLRQSRNDDDNHDGLSPISNNLQFGCVCTCDPQQLDVVDLATDHSDLALLVVQSFTAVGIHELMDNGRRTYD
jgi:hypothetical protein